MQQGVGAVVHMVALRFGRLHESSSIMFGYASVAKNLRDRDACALILLESIQGPRRGRSRCCLDAEIQCRIWTGQTNYDSAVL